MNIHDLYGKWISTSDRTVIRFNPFTLVTPYGSSKYTIEQRLNFPYICYETGEMIYHEENGIPILSDTIMEYDGRGEIIIANMFVNMTLLKSQRIFAVNWAKQEIAENRFLRLWRSNHEKA